jgi:hypothetical protein
MRIILALVLLAGACFNGAYGQAADREFRLAQTTTPAPTITLNPPPSQTFNNCMISCGTQAGTCQNTCLAISAGVATASVTAVGSTTNPTQCNLNCTSQMLICQQNCTRQQ